MLQTTELEKVEKAEQEQRVSLVTVGLAGILAGAAGVTALVLTDKDIRKKMGKRAVEVRNALQKWSTELLLQSNHKSQLPETPEEVLEDVSHHEEKLHN